MSASSPQKSLARKLWIALRFVLFGCGGFYVMLLGSVAFAVRVFDGDQHIMSWFLSLPLAVAGVFMVLYGVGEWGRWGYLLVFLSIAVTFIACSFADSLLFPHSGKEHVPFALVITGVAAFLTLAAVRSYYERRVQASALILKTIWILFLWASCSGIWITNDFIEFRVLGVFRKRIPLDWITKLVLRRSTCSIRVRKETHNERRTSVIFMSAKGPVMMFHPEDIRDFVATFRAAAPDVPLVCKPRRKVIFELASYEGSGGKH